MVTAGSPIK